MNKIFTKDYILYYLAKALGAFFRALPVEISLFIGRCLGGLSMYFNKKRRRIAYANLKSALGSEYTPKELKRILKKTYANIGQGIVDVFLLPKLDDKYISRYIEFEDFEFANQVLKDGKGVIFLTAHFGTWEISHVALPFRNLAYTGIAREQKPYLLNELLNKYRESKGCRILMKGPAIKDAIRTLRQNGVVGMLVDQDAGKTGIFAELFGRDASWHRGIFEMALKTGASVVPGFAIRQRGPYVKFKQFEPIKLKPIADKEEILKDGFKQYSAILEEMIRKYPDQWLWQHRRWKSTPIRKVIILNDKRTGHLRQSEAVLNNLRKIWQDRGFNGGQIRADIIDVEFKNPLYKQMLSLGSNFTHPGCQGCMKCLKIVLKEDSYKSLMKASSDIVISCGSSTAGVNLILSKENNSKSVIIMKPPLINLNKYNLAIIPEHDSPPHSKNVVVTDGALNLITEKRLNKYKNLLQGSTKALGDKRIGLLLGGATKDSKMDERSISLLLDGLLKACADYNADILITTSRRTPKEIEALLRKRLKNERRCKLLFIPNEKNIEGAVEGILGLSNIAVTSSDSISMVSEAASSGAYTIVFGSKQEVNKRHKRFLDHLAQKDFIKLSDVENIYEIIKNAFRQDLKQPRLNDSAKIEESLKTLL